MQQNKLVIHSGALFSKNIDLVQITNMPNDISYNTRNSSWEIDNIKTQHYMHDIR